MPQIQPAIFIKVTVCIDPTNSLPQTNKYPADHRHHLLKHTCHFLSMKSHILLEEEMIAFQRPPDKQLEYFVESGRTDSSPCSNR